MIDKNNRLFGIVLHETPLDQGMTRTEAMDMIDMLSEEEFLPIEVEGKDGGSVAIGFITMQAANALNYDFKGSGLNDFIGGILAGMELESEDCTYDFKGIRIWLDRRRRDAMTLEELGSIMQEHGLVLRAIPKKVRGVYEAYHKDDYPDGQVMYLEEHGREMLVVERVPKNAGKFLIESVKNTGDTVWFSKRFFGSIEEAVGAVLSGDAKSPDHKAP